MKFDLTGPCPKCPFRTDIKPYLHPQRAASICSALIDGQATFACHETTVEDDGDGLIATERSQHCAGALIMLEHVDKPNQMMRIGERIGFYDRRRLRMDAPVYASPEAMCRAHGTDYQGADDGGDDYTDEPCNVVNGGCDAPANGLDAAEFECDTCGNPVCGPCSTAYTDGTRVCATCDEERARDRRRTAQGAP